MITGEDYTGQRGQESGWASKNSVCHAYHTIILSVGKLDLKYIVSLDAPCGRNLVMLFQAPVYLQG